MKAIVAPQKIQPWSSRHLNGRMHRSGPAPNHRLKVGSILVPIDFSTPCMNALKCALQLAKQFKAKLTILHVIEVLAVPEFANYPLVPDADRLEEMKKKLAALATEHGCSDVMKGIKVRTGVPYREITHAAESLKTDMIVIATRGYTGLAHALLGSTAERVVRHARCPVLVVPARS